MIRACIGLEKGGNIGGVMVGVRTIEKTGGGGVVVCVLSRLSYLCLFIFCVVGDPGFDAVSRHIQGLYRPDN